MTTSSPSLHPHPYPILSREYDKDFVSDEAYRDTLPDLQNGPSSLIVGAHVPIQHVGISNFRMPMLWKTKGQPNLLETSVTGTVSLAAEAKGINMSRIMRTFYKYSDKLLSKDVVTQAVDSYRKDLGSLDARILLKASLPLQVPSLRSGLSGWQYYEVAQEVIDNGGKGLTVVHLDYVYSSTCPCSLELSEHARRERGQLATPHSQRSVARISAILNDNVDFYFEDMIELCRKAVPTETQVMVKREDEQAFAELNAANPIFVEDAARVFAEHVGESNMFWDYRVVCSHQESLHSHDAVSVLTRGAFFAAPSLDPGLFAGLRV